MLTTGKREIYHIGVLGKALAVLDAFAALSKPRLGLPEIARRTGLPKNAVFRILYTLGEHGYVTKHNTEYELGPRIAELGNTRLRRKNLLAVAGPWLDDLRDRFSETVNLGVLDGLHIRYVDVRESPSRFRLAERVGGRDPLHCTALGKSYLAYLPATETARLLREAGMPRLTARTITTLRAMKDELAQVRRLGYAVDRGESMEGAFCVAVPILDASRAPLAAISISGPTARFHEAHLPAAGAALLEVAAAIRTALGHV
jgi:IclR family acetate operon transcriptional repressor